MRQNRGINLAKWNPATSKPDYVVAKDGSGTHTTINGAVAALTRTGHKRRPERAVIYVKAGVYKENVEIGIQLKNVMVVGDGADKTIVTGGRNVPDGATTYNSATFGEKYSSKIIHKTTYIKIRLYKFSSGTFL